MESKIVIFNYSPKGSIISFEAINGKTIYNQIESAIDHTFNQLPDYLDRSDVFNRKKRVIDKDSFYSVFQYLSDTYDLNDSYTIIEIRNDYKMVKILHSANKFKNNAKFCFKRKYSREIQISADKIGSCTINLVFANALNNQVAKNLDEKESLVRVYDLLSASRAKPLSRSEICRVTGLAKRTITYSVNELVKRKMIMNVNKTKSTKNNAYIICKNYFDK